MYQKRNATIFLTCKSVTQNAPFIFLISEAQRNFRNKFFDSVEAHRNYAIEERRFRTKLKRNLNSAIETLQHNASSAFFAILDKKKSK